MNNEQNQRESQKTMIEATPTETKKEIIKMQNVKTGILNHLGESDPICTTN